MTDTEKTDVQSGRADAPAEQRNEPTTITDADRAANPIGTARREREAERLRDQTGKFARKDDAKDKPEGQVSSKDKSQNGEREPPANDNNHAANDNQRDGTVPLQTLEAERAKRKALERQIADLMQRPPAPAPQAPPQQSQQPAPPQQSQQPAPPPAFWEDPEKALEHRMRGAIDPVSQQLQQQRMFMSRQFAVSQHGEDGVNGALSALDQHLRSNPGDHARVEQQLSESMDPVGDVVRWHKQQTTMREVGNDPVAYRERLKAEILAEMQQQNGGERHDPPPAAHRQPPQQQYMPSSFAAQPGGGPRGGAGFGGPKSLSEMLPRG